MTYTDKIKEDENLHKTMTTSYLVVQSKLVNNFDAICGLEVSEENDNFILDIYKRQLKYLTRINKEINKKLKETNKQN